MTSPPRGVGEFPVCLCRVGGAEVLVFEGVVDPSRVFAVAKLHTTYI